MSKVNISLDTISEEFVVTVDGEVLNDVTGVSIYKSSYDEDEVSISITISEDPEEKGGLRKSVYLCAADKSEAKEAQKAGYAVASVGDMVKIDKGDKAVARDIADMMKSFGKNRR